MRHIRAVALLAAALLLVVSSGPIMILSAAPCVQPATGLRNGPAACRRAVNGPRSTPVKLPHDVYVARH